MLSSILNKFNLKSKYSLISITELFNFNKGNVDINYKIPKCQRTLDNNRLIILNNNLIENFNPITPLYFCVYKHKRYIIDGQHRLNCYKKILLDQNLKDVIINKNIPIIDIYIDNEKEIDYYFRLINDTMHLNDIWLDENEDKKILITNVYNYFINKYPNAFKYKGKKRPFICSDTFLNQLTDIYNNKKDELNINNSQILINIIENLNLNYSKKDSEWFPSKGNVKNQTILNTLSKNNCLYLGMIPNQWINHLVQIPENNYEDNITQSFRNTLWIKYCGETYKTKCLCCNSNEISVHNFECGHILSKKNGGLISIENIVPICSFCNRSMGSTHMFKYMEKNNFIESLLYLKSKIIK